MSLQKEECFKDFCLGIEGCAGTSSGALAALCFVIGLNVTQLEKLTDIFRGVNVAPKMDMAMFIEHYGLDDGTELRRLIGRILTESGLSYDITFADLERLTKRKFSCCSTNLATQKPVFFSAQTHPTLKVVEGIYMSMCVSPLCSNHCPWTILCI